MVKLEEKFYKRKNVVVIARELIGKILVTNFNGIITSGRIVETEAYNGIIDKASHAFGGRRTQRTEVMYKAGGHAYVYLCYGIHHLFNVVTNESGIPHAV
ncbi:MAG: DNA-3-methyladenine glycosylase, partial [Bacteroidota bacterium]